MSVVSVNVTGESEFVKMALTLMRCYSFYQPLEHAAPVNEYSGIRASFSIKTKWKFFVFKLDDCTHSTNRPTVCTVAVIFSLAVFQPSVSDIDVSRRGLRGSG